MSALPPKADIAGDGPLHSVGAIHDARLLPWSLHPADSPSTVSSAHLHRAHRAKGNDDAQGTRIGLRAGGCCDHAQGQARHATGTAAPCSGDRDHASATAPERAGAALSAMNNRPFPPPLSVAGVRPRRIGENNRANAAEWLARRAGMSSFECRIRSSTTDLPDTVQTWDRCSFGSRPKTKSADTTLHFEPARHSHLVFQR
jgi:hypothetical protein